MPDLCLHFVHLYCFPLEMSGVKRCLQWERLCLKHDCRSNGERKRTEVSDTCQDLCTLDTGSVTCLGREVCAA